MLGQAQANLQRLLTQKGLSAEQLAALAGVDLRTVRGILDGSKRPHWRTLHRLALGLEVPADELFVDPARLVYRRFDRATNPVVDEVVEGHPKIFEGWNEADFDELHSRFGTGGPLTASGALAVAERMNRNRGLYQKLAVLLETSQAELIRGIIELMYDRAVGPPESEEKG
jgi:transcriptional regulator with XRE-family HTH domain